MLKLIRLGPGTKLNKTYTEVQISIQMSISGWFKQRDYK